MNHDDTPVGKILSRREVLELLGSACLIGTTMKPDWAFATTHACVVRPEQGEGPYFVDGDLNRYDIRSDPSDGSVRPGVPFEFTVNVSSIRDGYCQPLTDARVDIWHCDALGEYSDVEGTNSSGKKFLRGYQISNNDGNARFLTVYPGWYQRRTVHIHLKVRTDPGSREGFEFTSQLYFDDVLTDNIHTVEPYAARGLDRTRNKDDRLFRNNGDKLIIQPVRSNEGYVATFGIAMQLS